MGTFQGTLVSANGVNHNKTTGKPFRVWQLGRQKLDERTVGRLLLDADLTDAYGTPLPRGTSTSLSSGSSGDGQCSAQRSAPDLGAIQQEVRQEIREDRQELKQLSQIEVPHERSIRRWLRVQLQVLQARRTYPTDEVLKQIDESMGSEPTPLHKISIT